MAAAGSGLAHSVLAYKSTRKGLTKLVVNGGVMAADLDKNWEVLTEPIQTVMRKHGYDNAYELLKYAHTYGQWRVCAPSV